METIPLFDDIPVTNADIEAWLETVPNLSKAPFRREIYVRQYRVAEKIRAVKRAGNWPNWEG